MLRKQVYHLDPHVRVIKLIILLHRDKGVLRFGSRVRTSQLKGDDRVIRGAP